MTDRNYKAKKLNVLRGRKVSSQADRSETGATMMLFAVVVVVLFMMLALALDTSLFSASRAEHRQAAEAAILGAVETYGEELSKGKTREEAFEAAIERSKEALAISIESNVARNFLQSETKAVPQNDIGPFNSPGKNGYIIPVKWYFPTASEKGCTRDPSCPADCRVACSVELKDSGAEVNALRLTYKTNDDSQFKLFLGKIFDSSKTLQFEEVATGTLVPRNAVFALDLSNSMTEDSHDLGIMACNSSPYRGRFTYDYPWGYSGGCPAPTDAATMPGYDYFWANCPEGRGFTGDYECSVNVMTAFAYDVEATNPSISPLGTVVATSWIQTNPTGVRGRPEPLSSALDGINIALDFFKTRRVPGDRVGIVAFDAEWVAERILADADAMANDQKLILAQVGSPEYDAFLAATDTSSITNFTGVIPLFPRSISSVQNVFPGSDIYNALRLSRRMINDTPDSEGAQNFVVAFTDGLANCRNGDCQGSPGSMASVEDWQDYYDFARAQVDSELVKYKDDRIAFHLFLVGSSTVSPHELAWRNTGVGGGCLNQDGIRAAGLNVINDGVNDYDAYRKLPFTDPNRLAEASALTGGLYHPVRPCYKVSGKCTPLALVPQFLQRCAQIVNSTGKRPTAPYWDSQGRIKYDLYGQDTKDQILGGMQRILSKPPFMLVRE